uniref:Uncharacterized protein n=1 Tax=Meloidogyne incognita TaxID=6306 RepID=A0A914N3I6_MELIC
IRPVKFICIIRNAIIRICLKTLTKAICATIICINLLPRLISTKFHQSSEIFQCNIERRKRTTSRGTTSMWSH